MAIEQKQRELIESLDIFPTMDDKLSYLISLGRKYPALDDACRSDEYLMKGCMSQLWFYPEMREGLCHFQMDADALIPKGVAAAICGLYNGESPAEVLAHEPTFIQEAGIGSQISSKRLSGLANLREAIKRFAQSQIG